MTYAEYSTVADMRAGYAKARAALRYVAPRQPVARGLPPPVVEAAQPEIAVVEVVVPPPVPVDSRMSLAYILDVVVCASGLPIGVIRGRSRYQNVVAARQVFFYLGIKAGYSSQRVGTFLGDFEHATVLHGAQKIKDGKAYANDKGHRARVLAAAQEILDGAAQ